MVSHCSLYRPGAFERLYQYLLPDRWIPLGQISPASLLRIKSPFAD